MVRNQPLRVSYQAFDMAMLMGDHSEADGGGKSGTTEPVADDGGHGGARAAAMLWSLVEGANRGAPSVLVCADRSLVACDAARPMDTADLVTGGEAGSSFGEAATETCGVTTAGGAAVRGSGASLLPTLSQESRTVRLPASILQKSIRRVRS